MRGGPLGRSLASPRPAPSSPGQTASPPPSGSHVRSAGASMRQAVARPSVLSGCVLRLGRRRATRRPQPARFPWDGRPHGKTPPGYAAATARLMPRARLDATAHRRQDTDAPRPAAAQLHRLGLAPPAWLHRRAELAPWPPPEALPPCALRADPTRLPHTIGSGTMRACENGGPPPLPFSGGERDLLPSQNGRGGERPPPPPLPFSGGEERRVAPGSRLSAAHLRTGGEEECTGTADTNPGCNYLVRGYSPSMHYFWRGDMPHFSPPLPFQPRAGARPRRARSGAPACAGLRQSPTPAASASSTSAGLSGVPAGGGQWWSPDPCSRRAFDLGRPEQGASACRATVVPDPRGRRAVDLGRPEQGARTCQAAAVTQPLRRACRRPWPARRGPARRSPRGPSAAGRDRRNLKLACRTGRWPAEASTGPRRRRPCPIFTLRLILLTTPS